jgi:hypothetical protein
MDFKIEHRKTGYVVLDDGGNVESTRPSQSQAENRIVALGFPAAWRKRVAAKLPRNLTPAYRNALISNIAESIQIWFSIAPEVEPHRKKLTWLAAEADRLERTVKRVTANLSKRGADFARGMHSADGALCSILARAAHDLGGWNRMWRPAKARPQNFSVALSKRLRGDFVLFCGKNARGFKPMLKEIEQAHSLLKKYRHLPPLPKLTVSALEKRKHRATKRTKSAKDR